MRVNLYHFFNLHFHFVHFHSIWPAIPAIPPGGIAPTIKKRKRPWRYKPKQAHVTAARRQAGGNGRNIQITPNRRPAKRAWPISTNSSATLLSAEPPQNRNTFLAVPQHIIYSQRNILKRQKSRQRKNGRREYWIGLECCKSIQPQQCRKRGGSSASQAAEPPKMFQQAGKPHPVPIQPQQKCRK